MSKESRAANKALRKERAERYTRIRKVVGLKAMYREAWEDTKEEFSALSLWKKPFYILRILIGTPIAFALGLIIILVGLLIAGFAYVLVFVIENFWKCFAVFCLVIAIFVLVNLGVL